MKRSEWLVFADIARDLRMYGGGGYYYDEVEAARENGKDDAREDAAERIEYALKEAAVDVEDVDLCSGVLVGSGPLGLHPAMSNPWYASLKRGCTTCSSDWAAKQGRTES